MVRAFMGWAVWNKDRQTMVFPDGGLDSTAFVWDEEEEAREHCRDGYGDEPIRVRVTIVDKTS